mgnify:FL=1
MKLKKFAAAALTAVMSLAMLTACGGGGNGGGATVAPGKLSETATYKMMQEAKDKSVYMEFWVEGAGNMGDFAQNDLKPEEIVWKEGVLNGRSYMEKYERSKHVSTLLNGSGYSYQVLHYNTDAYSGYAAVVGVSEVANVKTPEGTDVYLDMSSMSAETSASFGSTPSTGVADAGKLNESTVTTTLGKYNGYDAECFTLISSPDVSITYAYDSDGQLKLIVYKAAGITQVNHINKFEIGSSEFKAQKLDLVSYNAVDRTAAYIEGLRILQQTGNRG